MVDSTTYSLPTKNYVFRLHLKKQIVIGNTFNSDMNHYVGWTNRLGGSYKRTAAFTVSKDGKVYMHFDPNYCSEYLNDHTLDNTSIVILLENEGWLSKDIENNRFITINGGIYKGDVIEKRWRGHTYWVPYTKEQVESTIKLVKNLCKDFMIPLTAIGHNTKVETIREFEGVVYKSNIDKNYTDLSPAWDCEHFKNKLEDKVWKE